MRRAFVILAFAIDALISAAAADPDCTCRARGRDFVLGQSVCLATPSGARIATCAMVLNNTSWQFTETPCVVSHRPPASAPIPTFASYRGTLRRTSESKEH